MADYTVNVVGVNSGGGGSVPPTAPTPGPTAAPTPAPANRSEFVPDSRTIVDDFRRLVQSQGGVIVPGSSQMNQLYRQFGDQQKENVRQQVADKYNARRAEVADKYAKEREYQLDSFEEDRQKLREKGKGRNSKEWKQLEKDEQEEFRLIDKREKAENSAVDKDEKDELATALHELTNVLKDSKEAAERDDERGDGVDSYLGRLRADRRKILEERDNAATEEETIAASKRLAEKDEEIRKATSGGKGEEGKPVFDRYMMGMKGVQGMFDGLENGDMGGAVMGLGSTISGFGGLSLKAAMRVAGIAALAAGAIKTVHGSNERYNSMADLAAYRSTSGGRSGTDALMGIGYAMQEASINNRDGLPGTNYADFDLDYKQFTQRAANVVQQRGTGEGWYSETMKQIGLERQFGLRSGALEQGSQFDRYGQNVTDAITSLVSLLSTFNVEGANAKDFSRVQEKYDFQQNVMQGYLSRSDKPNYDEAARAVLAINQVSGITHDQRDVSDYASFQNAIQNPKNDRMRALLYSTVQEMMPEMKGTNGENYTAMDAGRMDLIDRAIRNPQNEGKIMQAMVQKISEMYGGIDTQVGYFAFKNLFPDIAPDRLDEYVRQFSNKTSDAGWALSGGNDGSIALAGKHGAANSERLSALSAEYTNGMTRAVDDIKKELQNLVDVLTLNANLYDPIALQAATN